MIFETIDYSESHETLVIGVGVVWRKVSVSVKVEDGEKPSDVIEAAKNIVDTAQKKYAPPQETFAPPIKIDPKISRMKLLIDSATTKAQLTNYRFQCPKELEGHLNEKLKQLKK